MMSLFKRENKEDKERRKLEKKLAKESKLQQQLNNVNLSNTINKTNSLDSTVLTTTSEMMDNSDINNTSINVANLRTKFELTPELNEQQQAPPRPKKGILKGMSKFTQSLSSTSSISSTSSPIINKVTPQQQNQQIIIDSAITTKQSYAPPPPPSAQSSSQQQNLNIDINNLNLPDIKKLKDEQSIRELYLTSNLDKLNIIEKNLQYIIEYSLSSSPTNDGLLPGDVLIQINNINVKDLNINQIKQQIISHLQMNKPLQIKVKTSPESLEFIMRNTLDGLKIPDSYINNGTLKRVGSLRHKQQPNLLKTQISNEQQQQQQPILITSTSSLSSLTSSTSSNSISLNDDFVWLVHTNGYSSAKIINKINDTNNGSNDIRYKIKLDNGNIIEVNEENIEKANPSKFDRIEDLSNLRFINETSIIHTIRQRYGSSLIHTYAGTNLIIVKPTNSLSIYNDKVISMFKGCKQDDMPPHIYSYTQSIYRNMLSTRLDHSIILMGHSGSGKSANSKHIIDYLSKAVQNNKELINDSKINAMFCLLEAFCSIQTLRNEFSNRFINVFLLEFGNTGQIVSLLLQLIVLDQTRLIFQSENETNYLIFYYLLYGADLTLKNDLQLNNSIIDDKNLFIKPTFKGSISSVQNSLQKILNAFKILNFNDSEIKSILSILAAIYHLGNAGAVKITQNSHVTYNRGQFQQQSEASKAANLLGINIEQLSESVFTLRNGVNKNSYSTRQNTTSSHASPDQYAPYQHNLSSLECLYGFIIGLYQECLNLLTNCINRSFKLINQTSISSLLIVDPPGFQSTTNANYSDLISNYLSERFQLLFYQLNFINPIEIYTQEGLDIDLVEHIPESPSSLVNWFDKPPNVIRDTGLMNINSSNNALNNFDSQSTGLGLLWLLEEELLADSKTSSNFIRKLTESDRKQNYFSINTNENQTFTIYHQFGQYPVEYNSQKWLQTCKDYPTIRNALILLQESKRDAIIESFVNTQFNSYTDIGTGSSLKRQASVRKMLTMSKKKTFAINLKLQLDSLFDSIRRTKSNFVFCLLPYGKPASPIKNGNGSPTTGSSLLNSSASSLNDSNHSLNHVANQLDVPLLRNQLKAYQILAACRIYRQGFPDTLNYDEFKRRYLMLTNIQADCLTDSKQTCSNMIKILDFELTQYKYGFNKLFFKAGILNKLEDQREEKINDLIKRLQCYARTYLSRKNYERKKVEISAIRCIQNNIRKYYVLKKWPWWKLYTNLMPIVNVQNNEVLVKQYKDELDDIKRKYDRLVNEKNDLKLMNNQLETKFMNLQTEYVEEHAANAGTIDLLEVETSERMRLERELNEIRQLYEVTLKKVETVENELLEYRLNNIHCDDIDGLKHHNINDTVSNHNIMNNNNNNNGNGDEIYINEKFKRDYEFLKQQYKQDKENLLEQNEQIKINFENKFKELTQLNDNYENQLTIYKRKYQKLQEEIQDIQRFNDEYKTRNKELERIQSKFDSDMHDLKQELEKEINLREKYQREKDQLQYETYNVKANVENLKLDLDYQKEKCIRLEKDLKEYESTVSSSSVSLNSTNGGDVIGGSLQQQVIKLKSQLREMEIKFRDQEEELDDQAGTIQQLEQVKLRLEMQLEKEKQKLQREIAEKESEMDDLRFHTQKKIKSIEIQLEEESEINSNLQREKRELERKIREHEHNLNGRGGMSSNDYEYLSKLKRQLQKYKALAMDSQTQLEKLRDSNIPKQASIVKQLKIQLEESEVNKANALKAKQLMQNEIDELQSQIDDLLTSKQHAEEHNIRLQHEINDLKSQLDEQERESDEILKKYQNQIQNFSLDSTRFIDLNNQIDLLTIENRMLKDKLRELEEKTNYYETAWIDKTCVTKYESKIRDLECKLDLEQTYKNRLQNQIERLKQQYDKSLIECEQLSNREKKTEDGLKRVNRHNKETQEEITDLRKKLTDYEETKKRLEDENDILEKELNNCKNELKTALNRIENFKNALNAMNDSSDMEFDSDVELGTNSETDDHHLIDDINLIEENHDDEYDIKNSTNNNYIYGSM